MDGVCSFCSSYTSHKNVRDFKRNHPEWYGAVMEYEIRVAMVIRSWVKGNKKGAGRTVDFKCRGVGYSLNFCPECGRRLHGKKT